MEVLIAISMLFWRISSLIAGWLTIMEFMTAVSSVASGWASYLKAFWNGFSLSIPRRPMEPSPQVEPM